MYAVHEQSEADWLGLVQLPRRFPMGHDTVRTRRQSLLYGLKTASRSFSLDFSNGGELGLLRLVTERNRLRATRGRLLRKWAGTLKGLDFGLG